MATTPHPKLHILSTELAEIFSDGMSHVPKSPRQACSNLGQFQSRTATLLLTQHGLCISRTQSCIEYPIDFLHKNGKIPKDIQGIMHTLRMLRNRAEHPENSAPLTAEDAETASSAAQKLADFICEGIPAPKTPIGTHLKIPASAAATPKTISQQLDESLERFKERMKAHEPPFATECSHVFWTTSPASSFVIVGKNPGPTDQQAQRPFAGKSGELLDTLLSRAKMTREQFHITNAVKACLPSKTELSEIQLEYYRPLLAEEIRIVAPKKILCLGYDAFKLMSGQTTGEFKHYRGRPFSFCGVPTIPTYHPAALLYAQGEPWEKSMTQNTQKDFDFFQSLQPQLS